jgi:methyltransferase (TIGR00027 family)
VPEPSPERGALAQRRPESGTAETTAAERAAESLLPREVRLLDDPYARRFVRRAYLRLLCARPLARAGLKVLDRIYPGLHAEIILRTRYADEAIVAARAAGIRQVVLVGAGFDSTALRHAPWGETVLFEVDQPATQRAKRLALDRDGLDRQVEVVYVPCDFEYESIAERLVAGGLDTEAQSLFIWLGVSYYLDRDAFSATLDDLAAVSPPGSRLVLDYMDPEVIDGTTKLVGARRAARYVKRRGEPYKLGLRPDTAADLVARGGFVVTDRADVPELARRYGGDDGIWCSADDWIAVLSADRRR